SMRPGLDRPCFVPRGSTDTRDSGRLTSDVLLRDASWGRDWLRIDLKDQPQARSGGRRGVTAPRRCLDRTIHPIPFEYGNRARRLRAAGRPGRRVRVQVLEELVRIDGSSVGDQRIWRLDDFEMHVRRIAEAGARIVGVSAAFREQLARDHVLTVRHIELADMTVEKRTRVPLLVPECIRNP